jgi:predicted homoserine dehydrogenase-like protein
MIGIDPTHKDPTQPLRTLEEYVAMYAPHLDALGPDHPGIVEYIVGARPGPGVFVLGTHDNPRQQHYLNLYKLGTGPYYLFYTPYHLCHFEAPNTIARAVLFNDAALTPMGAPTVGVVATAKRDLAPGDTIDMIGGYDTYGQAENMEAITNENLLPMGIAEGCKVKRAIAKGATLTYADVEVPAGRRIDAVYAEMLETFGLNKKAAA